jgi:ABC-type dipeptide/oligopeptide/nickel transport system ATPase subunit
MTAEPRTTVLAAADIRVRFGTGSTAADAVAGVSLDVNQGEAVGIVGESGSGKTTLARVLVGLQAPTSGTVALGEGQVVARAGYARYEHRDRRRVQMVFQDPYTSLNPRQPAWQAVAEAVHVWQGLRGKAAKDEAYRILRRLGVSDEQAASFPRALSGGQQQRVSVARALAPNPELIIADEPTSAIDQSAQAQLLNLLREFQLERRMAIIFISHDLGIVRYLTDRVMVMHRGVVVEEGPTLAVFDSPQHAYTRQLIDAIPRRPTRPAE